jgi:hypothetical protein
VFFAWGEIYSLFPSTCTDVYGSQYATTNAGLLYTAKGAASLLVPLGNVLMAATGSWHADRDRGDHERRSGSHGAGGAEAVAHGAPGGLRQPTGGAGVAACFPLPTRSAVSRE